MVAQTISWADKLRIVQRELVCCCVVLSDLLERRAGVEPDWDRLILALRRIEAVRAIL